MLHLSVPVNMELSDRVKRYCSGLFWLTVLCTSIRILRFLKIYLEYYIEIFMRIIVNLLIDYDHLHKVNGIYYVHGFSFNFFPRWFFFILFFFRILHVYLYGMLTYFMST